MEGKELIGVAKDVPQLLTTIYGDLAQPGVKKVGTALETVLEFSTSFLLPLKLLNEKFKLNFQKRLERYKEKLDKVPEEKICEVNPQIGTPILEKLSYTTNDEIAELFTNLLVKASTTENVNVAHPAFIQLIERLSVDEARLLTHFPIRGHIPCISIGISNKDSSYELLLDRATMWPFEVPLIFKQNTRTYTDNLVSMGILKVPNDESYMANEKAYNTLFEKYDLKGYTEFANSQERGIKMIKSYFSVTDFGRTFIQACTS